MNSDETLIFAQGTINGDVDVRGEDVSFPLEVGDNRVWVYAQGEVARGFIQAAITPGDGVIVHGVLRVEDIAGRSLASIDASVVAVDTRKWVEL
ncbi:MAG: hypothetical protein E7F72_08395 [Haemophilus parainfluenzae]|jgi:hypothetical protein|nr:hypothetical protein [Haemophilus parainfluenzae]